MDQFFLLPSSFGLKLHFQLFTHILRPPSFPLLVVVTLALNVFASIRTVVLAVRTLVAFSLATA
jgi:hypothetical protein